MLIVGLLVESIEELLAGRIDNLDIGTGPSFSSGRMSPSFSD